MKYLQEQAESFISHSEDLNGFIEADVFILVRTNHGKTTNFIRRQSYIVPEGTKRENTTQQSQEFDETESDTGGYYETI